MGLLAVSPLFGAAPDGQIEVVNRCPRMSDFSHDPDPDPDTDPDPDPDDADSGAPRLH